MEQIGIVGAGLIGRGWTVVFARAGHRVTMYDREPGSLAASVAKVEETMRDLAAHDLLDEPPDEVRARISPTTSLAETVGNADYVQESVAETLEAKVEVLGAIDALAPAATILASSTSTIPASAFSRDLPGRERCLVVHPFNPVHLIPLVELSPAPWTAAAVTERAEDLLRRVGQSPIVLRKEIQGFIVNRLQAALLCEAFRLWDAGYASADEVDRTVRDGLGLRWSFMGAFETFDLAAPGGIADSAARYGPTFGEIAASQVATPWSPAAVARLEAELEALQPRETLPERARWRDRRLMRLIRHKRQADVDERG